MIDPFTIRDVRSCEMNDKVLLDIEIIVKTQLNLRQKSKSF